LDLSTVTKNNLSSPVKNDSQTNVNTISALSTQTKKKKKITIRKSN